jgi:DNA-binding beta-propeller fold protein YncE
MPTLRPRSAGFASLSAAALLLLMSSDARLTATADTRGEPIPTGVRITPRAAPGSRFVPLNPDVADDLSFTADHAATTAVGPDGKTLLVLTSGYNSQNFTSGPHQGSPDPALSNEYVFVYDISNGHPLKQQVLQVPNALEGLAWNPNGHEFYVSGWILNSDGSFGGDQIFVFGFDQGRSRWAQVATIALGHTDARGLGNIKAAPAGIAVTADGALLVAANFENDSISTVDLKARTRINDLPLWPGNGVAGGEYPFWVAIKGSDTAFVSSTRDREIVVIALSGELPAIAGRIPTKGQPTKMILNGAETLLFALEANTDTVAVIDASTLQVVGEINTTAPRSVFPNPRGFKGSNPTGLTLSPDEGTLFVTNGGANSLAVIRLSSAGGSTSGQVAGLIPTGWYPLSVSTNADGSMLYVLNGKSNTGPNPSACRDRGSLDIGDGIPPEAENACNGANQYVWQLTKAGFLSLPTPTGETLADLTEQVARNNHYGSSDHEGDEHLMEFLRGHVKHVIYIVRENRTYDQILGDLSVGNGDPTVTVYPEPVTPNQHALAKRFVDLDNFYDSGEVSGDGWNWSVSAQANDTIEKTEPINYASRGLNYDYEGTNRNINVGLATVAERQAANPETPSDPDLLPGTQDVSDADSADGDAGAGYLWDAALRSGVSLRNYGFFIDLRRYGLAPSDPAYISPELRDPFASGTQVAFPTKAALQSVTDGYFRGYDNKFPDFYRVKEWAREFDQFERDGNLPSLEFVRVMHDHTGNFGTAIDGVNTPVIQTADNDYAVGLIVDKVSHSPRYKNNTLIFVIEDDAQDGPDHVDAHRSVAFVAGAYVRRGSVVSTRYTTVNMVRTIVDVLGIEHLNINEVSAEAMTGVFRRRASSWDYRAIVPDALRSTALPLDTASARHGGPDPARAASRPAHDAAYWEAATRGFDFTAEDRVDAATYNQILWHGIMGDEVPYPSVRSGADLRRNRDRLLKAWRAAGAK